MNQKIINHEVLSEVALLELLNVDKRTLDKLRREEDLPYIRLDKFYRVYMAEEVLDWLRKRSETHSKQPRIIQTTPRQ
jgi:hypothetical protein